MTMRAWIFAAVAFTAGVARAQIPTPPTCVPGEVMHVECYEPGKPCAPPNGCVMDPRGPTGWGSDTHKGVGVDGAVRCDPHKGARLCLMGFTDLLTGQWFYVYRPGCLLWCAKAK